MKTTIILCTLLLIFQGTIKMAYNEEVKPTVDHYKQEFKAWL